MRDTLEPLPPLPKEFAVRHAFISDDGCEQLAMDAAGRVAHRTDAASMSSWAVTEGPPGAAYIACDARFTRAETVSLNLLLAESLTAPCSCWTALRARARPALPSGRQRAGCM